MKRLALATALLGALAIALGFFFGETYIPRLPQHRGFYLVPVDDVAAAAPPPRPRHTVVIVVDGLRRAAAETLKVTATLQRHGQCRVMDVGPLTVSRPVYAILSTGLEADRTGSRNNDETTPLAAESIWDVARGAGLDVEGASHLPWFGQLFPDGFTHYQRIEPIADDLFARAPLGDLALFHPIYVDAMGHSFGGASAQYAAAVTRADREIEGLLARLDLAQDVVVLTADHGHTDRGGHGSSQPEVEHVLTCFAGPGIVRSDARAPLDGRSLAPALALRLGLRFPRTMRAGEDDLDRLFEIVDLTAYAAYAADRNAAIARFRAANEQQLGAWLGTTIGSWSALYARERSRRLFRLGLGLALLAAMVVVASRRRGIAWRSIATSSLWVLALHGAAVLLHVIVRGSFDFTAVNSRASYVPSCLAVGLLAGVSAAALHHALWRDRPRLLRDQLTALGVLLGANVLHPIAFGWPLGFPLPAAPFLLFPFFGAILLVAGGLVALAIAALALRAASPRP